MAVVVSNSGHLNAGFALQRLYARLGITAQIFSFQDIDLSHDFSEEAQSHELRFGENVEGHNQKLRRLQSESSGVARLGDSPGLWKIPQKDFRHMLEQIASFQPTHLISTIWALGPLLPEIRKRLPGLPVAWVHTDEDHSDFYLRLAAQEFDVSFLPSLRAYERARELGVAANKLSLGGVPVDPRLLDSSLSPCDFAALAQTLSKAGYSPRAHSIKIIHSGGSFGVGDNEEIFESVVNRFRDSPQAVDFLIVTGHNKSLADRLRLRLDQLDLGESQLKITVAPYLPDLGLLADKFFDVWISKPGGITSTEGVFLSHANYSGLRTIFAVSTPILHEEGNLLSYSRAGIWLAAKPQEVGEKIAKNYFKSDLPPRFPSALNARWEWAQQNYYPENYIKWALNAWTLSGPQRQKLFPQPSSLGAKLLAQRHCPSVLEEWSPSPQL